MNYLPTYGVLLAMLGWILFVWGYFRFLPAAVAMVAAFMTGWMFLPVIDLGASGVLNELNKIMFTCGVVALFVLVFDTKRIWTLRPSWYDLPILIWCLVPFAVSLVNGLGAYDGVLASFARCATWGVPYVLGRMYLSELPGQRTLVLGLVIAGLLYIPLCVVEIFAGPVLHKLVYGYLQVGWEHAERFGGWRPVVFMESGLMTALFMTSATLCGFWILKTEVHRPRQRNWLILGVVALLVTTLWLKSVNAWVLLALGIVLLSFAGHRLGSLLMLSAGVAVLLFVVFRAGGVWSGSGLPETTKALVGPDRAGSVEYRLEQENLMAEKVRQQPMLGWGGWNRYRVEDPIRGGLTVVDSLWIKAFGESGYIGLLSVFLVMLLPVFRYLRQFPSTTHTQGPAFVLAVLLVIYAVDSCLNAMVNPIFMLAAGGLSGLNPQPHA